MKAKLQLRIYETIDREKHHILSEFLGVRGLMPLLMKPRYKQQWTSQDKRELLLCLKSMSRMGTYIAMLVVPGGFVMLPVMAWWLVRRRDRRATTKIH